MQDPLITPQTDHCPHRPPASYRRSIRPAGVALAGSTFAVAGRTGPVAGRTALGSAHTGCCRSSLRRRREGLAGCRSMGLADRSPGLGRGSRRARFQRRGGWAAGTEDMKVVRLARIFGMPL